MRLVKCIHGLVSLVVDCECKLSGESPEVDAPLVEKIFWHVVEGMGCIV